MREKFINVIWWLGVIVGITACVYFALLQLLPSNISDRGMLSTPNTCVTLINYDDIATPEIQTAVADLAQDSNCEELAATIYATATAKAKIPAWWPWGH